MKASTLRRLARNGLTRRFFSAQEHAQVFSPVLLSHITMEIEELLLFSFEEKNENMAEAIAKTMKKYLPIEIKKL